VLRVLRAEFLKLRRAQVVLWTAATVVFFASFNVWGAQIWSPGVTTPTWEGILSASAMYMAGWWGILIFGLAAAHLFGAEYSEGTAASMLTTPIRRECFLAAKFIVLAAWVLVLVSVSIGSHLLAAVVQGATGFSWSLLWDTVQTNLEVAFLLYLTLPLTALISMLGRGYVAPMLFSTAVMTASWSCGFLGWARWFPWAMPSTVGGGLGPPDILVRQLGPSSWAIIGTLFVVGLIGAFAYVNRAGDTG
jgi:ABC-type transport system involved in multi-copper enzyme maturation permease subunit